MEATNKEGLLDANCAYTLDEFQARLSLGRHAWRTARRKGLKVRRVGGRGYVLGADALEWLRGHPVERK
ncbi:hypothetical protein [Adhaeretor mobilis]|uniref:Helix-turn-helix domain-containing protein n=1 Tax=Adhaeretor mobilis TaxID=1930276 RepID=A0A517MW06_9BACT|nr:hypothetical protein [Adhaeretor mobilis]QDS99048.1 hypothetical protein HG15A2_23380 [Adhaeretor mobilis]